MGKPRSRKEVRAQVVQRHRAAAAERKAREKANLSDLTEFGVAWARVEDINTWLAAEIAKAKSAAEERRRRYRLAAGKSLHAMRSRGESTATIAEHTGLSPTRVRELIRLGTQAHNDDTPPGADRSEAADRDVDVDPTAEDGQQMTPGPADTATESAPAAPGHNR